MSWDGIERRRQGIHVVYDRRHATHVYTPPPEDDDAGIGMLGVVAAAEVVADAFSAPDPTPDTPSTDTFDGFDGGTTGGGGAGGDF